MIQQPIWPFIFARRFQIGLLLTAMCVAIVMALVPIRWQAVIGLATVSMFLVPLIVRKPEWVIYGLIVFIPFEEFLEKWIPRGLFYEGVRFGSEVLLLLLLFFVILEKIRRGFRWYSTPIDAPLLLFVSVVALSGWLNSTPIAVGILGVRPLIRYVTIFYILTQLRVSPSFFKKCFTLSLVVATLVAAIGLMQTVIGYPLTNLLIPGDVVVGDTLARFGLRHAVPPRTYIFSTMGRYDTLGIYLMFFLLLSVMAYAFAKDGKWRRRILIFLLAGFPALALTFSRQAWVGFGFGLAVVLLLSKRRELQRTKLFYVLIVAAAGAFILLLIPYARYFSAITIGDATLLERILEPFSSRYLEVSRNYYGRLYVIFEVGPRLLRIAPILGLGPGQFGSLTTRFFDISFAHLIGVPESATPYISDVNWVVILGQVGIAGLLAFFWIYLSLFFAAFRRYRKWPKGIVKGIALGYVAAIVAVLLLGFFGPNFEVRQISFFVWLWGGLLFGLNHSDSNKAGV